MQAVGGAVIADIGGDRPAAARRSSSAVEIGALMDDSRARRRWRERRSGGVDMAASSSTNAGRANTPRMRALGLMSGTSLDGIDVAAIDDRRREPGRSPGPALTAALSRRISASGCAAVLGGVGPVGGGRGRTDPAARRRGRASFAARHPETPRRPDRLSRPHDPASRRTSAAPGRSATARCWRG